MFISNFKGKKIQIQIQIQIRPFSSCSRGTLKAKTKHKFIFRLGPIKVLVVYLCSPFPPSSTFFLWFHTMGFEIKSLHWGGGGGEGA
jgi:hypothetical protein